MDAKASRPGVARTSSTGSSPHVSAEKQQSRLSFKVDQNFNKDSSWSSTPDNAPRNHEQVRPSEHGISKRRNRWWSDYNWRWPYWDRRERVLRIPVWVQLTFIASLLGFLSILVLVIIMAAKTWQYSTQLMEYRLSTYAALTALQSQNSYSEDQSMWSQTLTRGIINNLMYSVKMHNSTATQYQDLKDQMEVRFSSSTNLQAIVMYDLNFNTVFSFQRMQTSPKLQNFNILASSAELFPLSNATTRESALDQLAENPSGISVGPEAMWYQGQLLNYTYSLTMGITHISNNATVENVGYATILTLAYQTGLPASWSMALFPYTTVYVAEAVDDKEFKYVAPLNYNENISSQEVPFSDFPAMYEAMLLANGNSTQPIINTNSTRNDSSGAAQNISMLVNTTSTYQSVPARAMMRTFSPDEKRASAGFSYAHIYNHKWLFVVTTPQSSSYNRVVHIRNVVIGVAAGILGGIFLLVVPLSRWQTAPLYRIYTNMGFEPQGPNSPPPTSSSLDASDSTLGSIFRVGDSEMGATTGAPFQIPARLRPLNRIWTDELDELVIEYNNMVDRLTNQYLYLEDEVRARTEEAQEARLLAEAANAAKSEFIANITHELRTPLNGIMGMTSVSVAETDRSKIHASLHTIIESGKVLVELLSELLAFSKSQVGVEPVIQSFTPMELLAQLRDVFRARAEARSVVFTMATVPAELALVELLGDSDRVLQVCMNVMSNAMKFSDEGRSVNIIVHLRSDIDRHISLVPYIRSGQSLGTHVAMLEVLVTDSGVGMDPTQLARIFDLFVQGDAALSKRHRGTGLGMSMSRQLAEGIGGYIAVFSAEGVGSTVAVRVPVGINLSRSEVKSVEGPPVEFRVQNVNMTLSVEAGKVTQLQGLSQPFTPPSPLLPPPRLPSLTTRSQPSRPSLDTGPSLPPAAPSSSSGSPSGPPSVPPSTTQQTHASVHSHPGSATGSVSVTTGRVRISSTSEKSRGSTSAGPGHSHQPSTGSKMLLTKPIPVLETLSMSPSRPPSPQMQSLKSHARVSLLSNSVASTSSLVTAPDHALKQHRESGDSADIGSQTEHNLQRRISDTTKVLVADDDQLNRQIMVRMLTLLGVPHVDTATDGITVIQMVERAIIDGIHYRIIFMDLSMPRMGGIEATNTIRGTLGYPYPIVALTGYSDAQTLEACYAASIQEVLPKPVMKADIIQVLAKYALE